MLLEKHDENSVAGQETYDDAGENLSQTEIESVVEKMKTEAENEEQAAEEPEEEAGIEEENAEEAETGGSEEETSEPEESTQRNIDESAKKKIAEGGIN